MNKLQQFGLWVYEQCNIFAKEVRYYKEKTELLAAKVQKIQEEAEKFRAEGLKSIEMIRELSDGQVKTANTAARAWRLHAKANYRALELACDGNKVQMQGCRDIAYKELELKFYPPEEYPNGKPKPLSMEEIADGIQKVSEALRKMQEKKDATTPSA